MRVIGRGEGIEAASGQVGRFLAYTHHTHCCRKLFSDSATQYFCWLPSERTSLGLGGEARDTGGYPGDARRPEHAPEPRSVPWLGTMVPSRYRGSVHHCAYRRDTGYQVPLPGTGIPPYRRRGARPGRSGNRNPTALTVFNTPCRNLFELRPTLNSYLHNPQQMHSAIGLIAFRRTPTGRHQ